MPAEVLFAKRSHVQYWMRCLQTILPTEYTSMDSTRLVLAFFILSALDLLGELHRYISDTDRQKFINWIYSCQHPLGGFRGSPSMNLGPLTTRNNKHHDPAHLATTFFALAALLVLRDDLLRVNIRECSQWLSQLQHENGSFGEFLGENETIEGGHDLRYCYLASAVRWILVNAQSSTEKIPPMLNREKLISFIKASQSYELGFGRQPFSEAHAAWTFCAISALYLLDDNEYFPGTIGNLRANEFKSGLVKWILDLQSPDSTQDEHVTMSSDQVVGESEKMDNTLDLTRASQVDEISSIRSFSNELLGFSGRCGKSADTCYSFWAGGTLKVLGYTSLLDTVEHSRFLLAVTQHHIGGFGKQAGDPPDIYHSYMGLAALATMGWSDLNDIDCALCISTAARHHCECLCLESW